MGSNIVSSKLRSNSCPSLGVTIEDRSNWDDCPWGAQSAMLVRLRGCSGFRAVQNLDITVATMVTRTWSQMLGLNKYGDHLFCELAIQELTTMDMSI